MGRVREGIVYDDGICIGSLDVALEYLTTYIQCSQRCRKREHASKFLQSTLGDSRGTLIISEVDTDQTWVVI